MAFVCLLSSPQPHYSLTPGAGTVKASIKMQLKKKKKVEGGEGDK